MNFIVLGAGALGCYLAGRLATGGRRVTLVGRPRIVEALADTGLTVSDLDGFSAQVPARQLTLATSLASVRMDSPNLVLLCIKASATESAALEVASCCPAGTTVIALQQGVDSVARIRAIAPRMRCLAGMLSCGVGMPEAGVVHRATRGQLYLERSDVTQEAALLLNACGLRTTLVRDLAPLQWGRLLMCLGNPVNASADQCLRTQLQDRAYRQVLANLQQEALQVMRRAGIRPARICELPARWIPHFMRLPNWIFARLADSLLHIDDGARSGGWDEIQHGRSADIQDLCAAVVRLAARHGMAAPRNAAMCELVQAQRKGWRLSGPQMRKTASP